MGIVVRLSVWRHARASAVAAGRAISDGQSAPEGQLAENQIIARSNRPTLISAPPSRADSFLLSFNARKLTVVRETPSTSAYRRATFKRESIPDMPEISVNLPVLSTAFLPDALAFHFGHPTGMDLKTVLDNIDRRLRVKKLSQDKASREAGHPDAIRNIRRKLDGKIKGQGLSMAVVRDLAEVLGTTAEELMKPATRIEFKRIPGLRGQLQAQLDYLDNERARVMEQLSALDAADRTAQKRPKRKVL